MPAVALAAAPDDGRKDTLDEYLAPALALLEDALSVQPSRVWHPECLTFAIMSTMGIPANQFDENGRVKPPCDTCANRTLTPVR